MSTDQSTILTVETPATRLAEREYIAGVLLGDFLGLEWQHVTGDRQGVRIYVSGRRGELSMPDSMFSTPDSDWLTGNSMPVCPLDSWNASELGLKIPLVEERLPVIYGSQGAPAGCEQERILLPIDVFGSAFFMLSRYEEVVGSQRDEHDRFPAKSAIAYKERFLHRPIVDEYVEVLWRCMKHLWPELRRRAGKAGHFITCDIDWAVDPVRRSLTKTARSSLRAIKHRRGPGAAFSRWLDFSGHILKLERKDPFSDAIEWIMTVNERVGNRVAFFILGQSTCEYDSPFRFAGPELRTIIRKIHNRGHEIGIHPGYRCMDDNRHLSSAVGELRRVLREENVVQPQLGSRMHYLRWDSKTTPRLLDKLGVDYDSTLGFADVAGFRCGTSREFPMYDLTAGAALKLRQRPLIAMEQTVLLEKYENLGKGEPALKRLLDLKKTCSRFRGQFTLLWHNTRLLESDDRRVYAEVIKQSQ